MKVSWENKEGSFGSFYILRKYVQARINRRIFDYLSLKRLGNLSEVEISTQRFFCPRVSFVSKSSAIKGSASGPHNGLKMVSIDFLKSWPFLVGIEKSRI